MKSKRKTKTEVKPPTLIELIRDTKGGIPMKSAIVREQLMLGKKRQSSASERTLSQAQNKSDSAPNQKQQEQSRYQSMLKPKVFLVDGKMQIQKPDISLINKQITEEMSKNTIPLVAYEEKKRVTSLSFKDIHHTNKWSELENKLFFRAIEVFGLDFSFLEIVLQPRKRGEIKRKYLKEEKVNSKLVDKAVDSKRNIEKMLEILTVYKRTDIDENKKVEVFQKILLRKRQKDKNEDKIKEIIQQLSKENEQSYEKSSLAMIRKGEEKEDDSKEEDQEDDKINEEEEEQEEAVEENNERSALKETKQIDMKAMEVDKESEIDLIQPIQVKKKNAEELLADQLLQNFN